VGGQRVLAQDRRQRAVPDWLRTFDQGIGTVRQHIIGLDIAGYDPSHGIPKAYDLRTANTLRDRMGYKARSTSPATRTATSIEPASNCG